MSFFTNLRIGTRLACAFALLLLLLLGQVGHALRALHGAEQAGDRLVDHEWAISRALARLDAASRANALATSELLFTRSPAEADAVRSRMATNRQVVTAALNDGWELHGSPSHTFNAAENRMYCGQAVVKTVHGKDYDPSMKLGEQ